MESGHRDLEKTKYTGLLWTKRETQELLRIREPYLDKTKPLNPEL